MSDNEVILRLTTAALLAGFLICKQWVRVRNRARQRAALRRQFQFHGEVPEFDVAPLRSRLDEVRRDFAQSAHAQAPDIHARKSLVIAARDRLGHLPFFQTHAVEAGPEQRAVQEPV